MDSLNVSLPDHVEYVLNIHCQLLLQVADCLAFDSQSVAADVCAVNGFCNTGCQTQAVAFLTEPGENHISRLVFIPDFPGGKAAVLLLR